MFDICLLSASTLGPDGQRLGTITVGNHTEDFACWPTDHPVEDFPSLWRQKLGVLVAGQPGVALIHDPRFAFIVYRDGQQCLITQRLSLDGQFDPVEKPPLLTEDGEKYDLWMVDFESVAKFVAT
ncbi:MAG: hypothetical protein R3B84_17175 [Zavarzinella sp.]